MPIRFIGIFWPKISSPFSRSPPRWIISGAVMPVTVRPGAMQLIRTSGRASSENCRVMPVMAALAAP